MKRRGIKRNLLIWNTLLKMYGDVGDEEAMQSVLNEMKSEVRRKKGSGYGRQN